MDSGAGPISLKPNKPETYDGRRDYLVINTWLYKIEQYLSLLMITNPNMQLDESTRITYASTFFTSTAAVWWYTLVQVGQVPTTWVAFKEAVIREFVPEDHVRRARDKLRRLTQTTSVSKYLADFRNVVLTVPDITDSEKWDKFCAGLKYEVRLEVMKSAVTSFEDAARIALRVDSALWNAGHFPRSGQEGTGARAGGTDRPTPMEIGNIEQQRGRRWDAQREKDYKRNACFKCHKVGCRPWKHGKSLDANNIGVAEESTEAEEHRNSDSEN